ncbi:hypothetical protein VE25_19690 [Devosia geojensis]|uniref:HTH lacI-type domain-containing protein n=1 Tax=Devosia geojensis TaxID=443610 RepID=A0A0F5FE06_9HYPH|nr:LacI family DNA-binding transcriptional regulator [Devosia geojensis]KKB07071.1 hypothetical protein VE25_19690 [Devosia geojensis]
MQKPPTMRDVADSAKVSQATVSLVLSGVPNARISKATRRRVIEAADALGYRREKVRSLRENHRRLIGLFIDEVSTTAFASPLIEGAREQAGLHNAYVATFCTAGNPDVEREALHMLASQDAIGVIYTTLITREVAVPEMFLEFPLVLLNCYERKLRFASIVPGDFVGGYTATETLLKAGHRRIAHLAGEHSMDAGRDRERGFRQAMADWSVPVDESLVTLGGWRLPAGRERALALLQRPDRPTAVFCFNDRMALGCNEAARSLGLRVPEDLSIVGFDDETDLAAGMDPPLTTMVLPHDEMARLAVSFLAEGGDADERLQKVKIECELVTRSSIAPPP